MDDFGEDSSLCDTPVLLQNESISKGNKSADSITIGEDPQLYISEYTYPDEDTQYERRRSLEQHSSTESTEINKAKLISDNSESDSVKPIVSFVQSFFKPSAAKSSWFTSTNAKADNVDLSLENLTNLVRPEDAIEALRAAIEKRDNDYTKAVMNLITQFCEQDNSKSVSAYLGELGACGLIDQILGFKGNVLATCEASLRAMCSLVTPPAQIIQRNSSTSNEIKSVGMPPVKNNGNNSSNDSMDNLITMNGSVLNARIASISKNRKRLSTSGCVYRIIKAAQLYLKDEILLEWALRLLYYVSLEQGRLIIIYIGAYCFVCLSVYITLPTILLLLLINISYVAVVINIIIIVVPHLLHFVLLLQR